MPFGGRTDGGAVVEKCGWPRRDYPRFRPASRNQHAHGSVPVGHVQGVRRAFPKNAAKLRLEQPAFRPASLHDTDAHGDCASIEFRNGELVCHHGQGPALSCPAPMIRMRNRSHFAARPIGSWRKEDKGRTGLPPRFAFPRAPRPPSNPYQQDDLDYALTPGKGLPGQIYGLAVVYDGQPARFIFAPKHPPTARPRP